MIYDKQTHPAQYAAASLLGSLVGFRRLSSVMMFDAPPADTPKKFRGDLVAAFEEALILYAGEHQVIVLSPGQARELVGLILDVYVPAADDDDVEDDDVSGAYD